MRDTRSLRVFNENYPLSRSFSLRVVGVLYPHTPLRGYYALALLSPPNVHLGYACDEAATSFLVLTALRHSGRSAPSPMRGYYTLALPCYLFIAHSNTRFVKELRRKISLVGGIIPPHPLARVLHPHAPCGGIIPPHPQAITLFLFHASVLSRNCAEKFRGQRPLKFFAPLTTTENYIINTRAERSPAPRLNCPTLRRNFGGLFLPAGISAGHRF